MKLRSLAVLLTLALCAVTLVAVPAAAVTTECDPSMNKRYRILTTDKSPKVTHAFTKVLAPGAKWKRETTIERVNVVKASVESYAEGTVGASRIIAKAELKLGLKLKAAGSHTRRSSYSESLSISNNTGRNREYVVFSGTMKHFGKYRIRWCGSDYRLRTKEGAWRSWTVRTSGTIRCGDPTPSGVPTKARRLYCGG